MLVFTGRYDYTTDDKGRLSIPAKLRDQVTRANEPLTFYVTQGRKGQLSAYTESQYKALFAELGARTDEEASEVLRALAEQTDECPVDAQGRIILNAQLRAAAGITRDVAIVGAIQRVEFWDKKRYEKYKADGAPRINAAISALKGRADLL